MEIINKLKNELKNKNINSIKGELKFKNYIFGWDFEKSVEDAQKSINGNKKNPAFNLNKAINNLVHNIINTSSYSSRNSFIEKEENGLIHKKIDLSRSIENNYIKVEKYRIQREYEKNQKKAEENKKEIIKNKKITNSKNFLKDFYSFYCSNSEIKLKDLGNTLINDCFWENFIIEIIDEKKIKVSCDATGDKYEKSEIIDITTYIDNDKLFHYILFNFE